MKRFLILAALPAIMMASCASFPDGSWEVGPYTVTAIAPGVYDIEDCNSTNPAGMNVDADGKYLGMNNCSNMYLVLGRKQALLIDLSNKITWADNADESLKEIFYGLADKREKVITITHAHGDHTGMLGAFVDDEDVKFMLPRVDFEKDKKFPAGRTDYFDGGYVFDLGGGVQVGTVFVPGHTPGSMVFDLKGKNIFFSGDAVGSGTGVWIFSLAGYKQYVEGVKNLVEYIEDPANAIDCDALTLYGGHAWQKTGHLDKLDAQYVYDMQTLVGKIAAGEADWEPYRAGNPALNANFKYGTATITWSTNSYKQYCTELGVEPKGFED